MKGYIPSNLNLGASRHSGKYYYILTQLYYGKIFDKRIDKDSFVPLNGKILIRVLGGRYKNYIQFLLDKNIIETDNRYVQGEKSKGYKLKRKYAKAKPKQVTIPDKNIIKNVEVFKLEQEKNIQSEPQKYIYECLKNVSINYNEAQYFVERNITKIEEYTSYNISIDLIESKSFFFVVDSTAGRVHNNITNLSKNLRPFLNYNNQQLVEIDIANSQPFLFNILIYEYQQGKYRKIVNGDRETPSYGNHKKTWSNDLILYKDLTSKGMFYEYLMDELSIKENRDDFKITFFGKVFYSTERIVYEERKRFKELFPNVSKIISHYKKGNYKNLPIRLQRAEADIMINKIVPKLTEQGMYVLTIHDSILTTPDNVETVKEIITNEFKTNFGFYPTLRIKA